MKKVVLLWITLLIGNSSFVMCSDYDDFEKKKDSQSQLSISATEISSILNENKSILTSSKGKDITVFVGHTGSGKSTLTNLLAGVDMEVYDEELRPKTGQSAATVAGGFISETRFPKYMSSRKHGNLYDLPGFNDTKGALTDLLNAAFIRSILMEAKGVRVIMLTTESEITGSRGKNFKTLARAAGMFSKDFRSPKNKSCLLAVNCIGGAISKAQSKLLDKMNGSLKEEKDSDLEYFRDLIQQDSFIALRQFREEDGQTEIEAMRSTLGSKIESLKFRAVGKLDMSLTLSSDTGRAVDVFWNHEMRELLENMKAKEYKTYIADSIKEASEQKSTSKRVSASDLFKEKRDKIWDEFEQRLEESNAFKLFNPICGDNYTKVLKDFRIYFDKEHLAEVQLVALKEEKEQTEIAEQKQKEAEKQAKEKEKLAREADIAAQAAKKKADQAQVEAEKQAEIAKKAQQDKNLSDQQKEAAQRVAAVAASECEKAKKEAEQSRSDMEKAKQASEQEMNRLKEATEEATQAAKRMQKTYEARLQTMQEQMEERERRSTDSIRNMSQQVADLRKAGDDRAAEMDRKLKDAQDKHAKEMEDMARRKDNVKKARESDDFPPFIRIIRIIPFPLGPSAPVMGPLPFLPPC